MSKKRIAELRAAIKRKYETKIRKLENDLARATGELEGALKALEQMDPSSSNGSNKTGTNSDRTLSLIKSAIRDAPDGFTAPDILKALQRSHGDEAPSRSRISKGLKELTESGDIRCVLEGKGRRAAKYSVASSNETDDDIIEEDGPDSYFPE